VVEFPESTCIRPQRGPLYFYSDPNNQLRRREVMKNPTAILVATLVFIVSLTVLTILPGALTGDVIDPWCDAIGETFEQPIKTALMGEGMTVEIMIALFDNGNEVPEPLRVIADKFRQISIHVIKCRSASLFAIPFIWKTPRDLNQALAQQELASMKAANLTPKINRLGDRGLIPENDRQALLDLTADLWNQIGSMPIPVP